MARRLGSKKAAVAIARKILVIAYVMVKHNVAYKELGASFIGEKVRAKRAKYHQKQLIDLGFQVEIVAPAA